MNASAQTHITPQVFTPSNSTQTATFPVAERFLSINGEGTHAGQFAVFIRFAGCNLSCSYCDTLWACTAECPCEELTIGEIVDYINRSGAPFVTLTGGEPLLQPHLENLIKEIDCCTSCSIEIETNGSCALERFKDLPVSFTMDWKLPFSGMESHMNGKNLEVLTNKDCLKFVVGSLEDLEVAKTLIEKHNLFSKCPIFFSPVFGAIEPAAIVSFLEKHTMLQAHVQLQLHKIIWPNVEKGV